MIALFKTARVAGALALTMFAAVALVPRTADAAGAGGFGAPSTPDDARNVAAYGLFGSLPPESVEAGNNPAVASAAPRGVVRGRALHAHRYAKRRVLGRVGYRSGGHGRLAGCSYGDPGVCHGNRGYRNGGDANGLF